jgi:phage terminase large subunit-like protein
VIEDLEGTRVGRQELDGEYLEDVDGALWADSLIEPYRVDPRTPIDDLAIKRIAIGVDPSTKTGTDSDPSGIVVNGIDRSGTVYCMEDASGKYTPPQWGRKVLDLAAKWKQVAPVVVILETNKIGEMAEHNVRLCLRPGERMPKVEETHSSDSKEVRAEPFVALYERGRCRHYGTHEVLEACMTTWIPGSTTGSPDPLDAHVHSLRELVPNFGQPRILERTKTGAR